MSVALVIPSWLVELTVLMIGVMLPGFCENLNRLSSISVKPLGHAEVARRMTALGCPTTAAWVQFAREGKMPNPSAARVGALARVFEVPVAYFFDPAVTDDVNAAIERSAAGLL